LTDRRADPVRAGSEFTLLLEQASSPFGDEPIRQEQRAPLFDDIPLKKRMDIINRTCR
jgi:hypothetical protein